MSGTLYILAGPTASGKTDLALEWARRRNAVILSCDALCVYRGMNIGTAKPDAAARSQVPHFGINLVRVCERFSVDSYQAHALSAVREAGKRPLLVTGGSGFYLQSFFAPVADRITIPEAIRTEVAELEVREGLPGLLRELDSYNPDGTPGLDRRNPRRVVNALLRCRASGRTWLELRDSFARQRSPFADWVKRVCLVRRSREHLRERIERRTRTMIAAGLADEVAGLRLEGLESNPSAANAIGYRETLDYLDGKYSAQEWEAAINRNTRRLVRKQDSWFRHRLPVEHVYELEGDDPGDPSRLDAWWGEQPGA